MPAKVVDASALAAVLFGEPEEATIAGRLEGGPLLAPALLHFELANVCLTKMRRHPEQRAALRAAFGLVTQLAIEVVEVDHGGAISLAAETGLTAYDASYLWLADALGAELVTLDRRLEAAAAALRRPS